MYKPYNARKIMRGWMMMELAVVMVILTGSLSVIIPLISQIQSTQRQQSLYMDQQTWVAAWHDHLRAQWQRLAWRGCRQSNDLFIEIGRVGEGVPERIASKALSTDSDWLEASDRSYCSQIIDVQSQSTHFVPICEWRVTQPVYYGHCLVGLVGKITSIDHHTASVSFDDSATELIESIRHADDSGRPLHGVLHAIEPFTWYLATGKNGQSAFWRTPIPTGNSVELWSGVRQLAIYPLLDVDHDGKLDGLSREYGRYAVDSVKALWVESILQKDQCPPNASDQLIEHTNARGDVWVFDATCEMVTDVLVNLQ